MLQTTRISAAQHLTMLVDSGVLTTMMCYNDTRRPFVIATVPGFTTPFTAGDGCPTLMCALDDMRDVLTDAGVDLSIEDPS